MWMNARALRQVEMIGQNFNHNFIVCVYDAWFAMLEQNRNMHIFEGVVPNDE